MAEIILVIVIMIAAVVATFGAVKTRSQWDRDNAWRKNSPLLGVVRPKEKEEDSDK